MITVHIYIYRERETERSQNPIANSSNKYFYVYRHMGKAKILNITSFAKFLKYVQKMLIVHEL